MNSKCESSNLPTLKPPLSAKVMYLTTAAIFLECITFVRFAFHENQSNI